MASSQMRISGVNSGFDTEAMIQQMMSAYQTKIDTQNKKLQKLQWQQEQYRDITSKLTTFKNKYFDILKRDTYLMSPSSFNKFKTTITTKSGKESGLKVTTDSKTTAGSHKIKVDSVATAAVTKGGQVSSGNFKLDVDKAIKDATADDSGNYNFSLDVKVGNVAKTVEFSGRDKDELLASLNTELVDAFGMTSSGKAFISAEMKDGALAFKTAGNAMATVTERTGNFGMGKPAARVAIDPASALTGTSSISVTVPNYYDKKGVTKNITFDSVSNTYFDARDDDESVKAQYMELKKAAFLKKYTISDGSEPTEELMGEQNFIYSSADAAYDYNSKKLVSALNAAYGMEQGIQFAIDGSSMTAKYIMDGSSAEFTMTSTCDATFGLKKGSATSYIDQTSKLADMGIAQNEVLKTDYTLPSNFRLNIQNAIDKATPEADGSYQFSLDVGVGGVTKTVQFSGKDADEVALSLNSALATAFGDSDLKTVKNDNGTYDFKINGGTSLTLTENVGKFGIAMMSDKVPFNPGEVEDNAIGSHWITVSIDGRDDVNMQFSGLKTPSDFDPSDPSDTAFANLKEAAYRKANGLSDSDTVTADDLAGFAYTAVDAAADSNSEKILNRFNSHFGSDGITFEYTDGYLTAKDASGNDLNFSVSSDDGKFGLPNSSISYTFPTTMVPGEDTGAGYSMTINGKEIKVGADATINDLINAVNKSDAGVTLSYSKLEGAFTLTANDKGSGGDVEISGALADALKLSDSTRASHTDGTNAIITIDGVQVEHNDNTYELDGITFDFSDVDPDFDEEISVVVDKSYDDIKQTIKDFVKDYNQMIDEIDEYTQTARPQDKNKNYYEPLTDEDKEDMSEDEIKKWEEAAKKGLLYHDTTVSGVMSKIRIAMYSAVELEDGSKFALYSMGIKTKSDYNAHGKLEIDEDKLDKAFAERPEDIIKLFTDSENGVMAKVNKAIESATKDSTTTKNQGTLVRKAGLATGNSNKANAIYKEMERINKRIEQLQDRYDKKEEYWWTVFTNLEKMQAQFNEQQSYISQFTANGGYLS